MTDARGWARPENRKQRVSRLVKATKTPRLGRIHLQIWRRLANAGEPQTTPELVRWCFSRLTKFKPSHYSACPEGRKEAMRPGRSYDGKGGSNPVGFETGVQRNVSFGATKADPWEEVGGFWYF
jgi:hypothetical protein